MGFSDEIIETVWRKGKTVEGKDPSLFRKDDCNAWMRRKEHGNRNSIFGWEVDHINPNGSDNLDNLRPLQWENNVNKQDGKLKCPITSNGEQNTRRTL